MCRLAPSVLIALADLFSHVFITAPFILLNSFILVTSSFPRSWQKHCLRAAYLRNRSGEALVCNKVADGNTMRFIGTLSSSRKFSFLVMTMISYAFVFQLLFSPEPHILLFRRPLGTDPQSGRVDAELLKAARDEYKDQFGLRK